jgi:plasmid stability protein
LCIHGGFVMQSSMATLTLKDLPVDLHRKLKARAEQNGRSLNREVIECLEASFRAERIDVDARIEEARAIRQSLTHRLTDREITRLKRQGRP